MPLSFRDLPLDADLVEALEALGIERPFPIQEQAIPLAVSGQDLIAQAQTGTGKTLGFALSILQRLGTEARGVRALVVVPTRELCLQVCQDFQAVSGRRRIRVGAIYGGVSQAEQIRDLEHGSQVVIGTPGRLLDLLGQKLLSLSEVSELVLDEADRMLDMGFLPDVENLLSRIPKQRHTMLFSATIPASILALARRFMQKPIHIRASVPGATKVQNNIRHLVYRVHGLDKDKLIAQILRARARGKTVIFVRTKRSAAKLYETLADRGYSVAAVHGDLAQVSREKAMKAFKSGHKEILIATDVAARGIDVEEVTHVINYSMPEDEEVYLHRAGRTGRAGLNGIAVTFVEWGDLPRWSLISRSLGLDLVDPPETYSSSAHLFTDLDIPPAKPEGSENHRSWARAKNDSSKPSQTRGPKRSRSRRRNLFVDP